MPDLLLLRHGETEWSRTQRHTGVTDLPLTDRGREQAVALGAVVRRMAVTTAVVSPRLRARETADLAGLAGRTDADLAEWDYGGYEGLTTAEISDELGRAWTVWGDGVIPGDTPGETIEQVAARAARVLDGARSLPDETVALVAHGHLLRVLTAVWVGQDPRFGAHLELAAGSWSVLSTEHGTPTIAAWSAPG